MRPVMQQLVVAISTAKNGLLVFSAFPRLGAAKLRQHRVSHQIRPLFMRQMSQTIERD